MTERAPDVRKQFEEAKDDSWWYCKAPGCHRAYQKGEAVTPGVCPYCETQDYMTKPWESALLSNPDLPKMPESGEAYRPRVT
jgi:hypothetical protein